MKRLLFIAIALVALSLNAQITGLYNLYYQLDITQVSSYSVTGTLTMTNYHNQDWQMEFGNSQVAEIWVDNLMPMFVCLPMVTLLTIPAHQSHVENVGYYYETPLSEGYHLARAHIVDNDHTPVTNDVQFWAGTILSDFAALDWTLNLTEVNADSVSAILSMHNPTTHLWQREYNAVPLFYLSVDGSPLGGFMYWEDYVLFSLEPGETKTWPLSHHNYVAGEPANYSAGVHSAQAKTIWDQSALLGDPIEFTIIPSSLQDEHLAVLNSSVYPNPFSALTSISISANKAALADIYVYNLKGQQVQDMRSIALSAGENKISWQAFDSKGKRLPNGTYLIKIVADGESSLIKMQVIR